MKPAPFAYARPETVEQAVALLAEHGEGARLISGGQSLMAVLNMRLAEPALLVDINRIADLSGIAEAGGTVRIGATTRLAALEDSAPVARHLPLLAAALPHIAHPAIRNRGTVGGSLALADPAAELPACALALGARMLLRGPSGARTVAADAFFKGLYETDLRPGEVLTAVEIPKPAPGAVSRFGELARRAGDYALAGLAAHAVRDGGVLREVRLVYFGLGAGPVAAARAAAALEATAGAAADVEAAADALAGDLDPPDDAAMRGATRLHLARVLTRRVLAGLGGAA